MSTAPESVPPDEKPPLTVWLFIVFSWLIGAWMAYEGLRQRLFGPPLPLEPAWLWTPLMSVLGLGPHDAGWLLLLPGLSLIAASFGVYLRRRWGYNVGLGASAIALLYLGFGAGVPVVCLILLLLRPTRMYMNGPQPAVA